MTAEIANRISATKKMILAMSTAKVAMPPKPSTAAINATMRNVRAQPSITSSRVDAAQRAAFDRPNPERPDLVPSSPGNGTCDPTRALNTRRSGRVAKTMAKRSTNKSVNERSPDNGSRKDTHQHPESDRSKALREYSHQSASHADLFTHFAQAAARWSGRSATFLIAVVLIVVWAVTGPIFNFSDTWQLIINTTTTIITFLMVFLIQNTQNRDTLALQVKLADLIIAVRGAHNRLAAAEDLSDEDLEKLHEEYRTRAQATLDSLEERRGAREDA